VKIYHLDIQDEEDSDHDVHLHYSHDTKTATQLWEDYHNSYSFVIDNLDEWCIKDVLDKLESMGWKKVDIERVIVDY